MAKIILPEISQWKTDTHGIKYHVLPNVRESIDLVEKWIEKHPNYYSHVIGNKLIVYHKEE